ncbi:MAG: Protein translocase membrane subunit SecG, partial [uncultured Solirubrobacteraceae bacterium]
GDDPLSGAGRDLRGPDLPGAHALREGRRPVGRLRRRLGRRPLRRRLARRAQPQPLDGRVRAPLRDQHDRPAEDRL